MMLDDHDRWMRRALALAREAGDAGEVPVGLCGGRGRVEIVGQARNSPIDLLDPTAHAEMLAIRQAALADRQLPADRRNALLHARALRDVRRAPLSPPGFGTLVFGARDLRFGGVRSKFQIADSPLLNHRVEIVEGVLGAESTEMLQRFFNSRR